MHAETINIISKTADQLEMHEKIYKYLAEALVQQEVLQ